MNEYDFSTLNDKDFEILVKDLLNADQNLQLQHFKSGKDKGIDLRFSTHNKNNSVVVQAKHFLLSGLSQLKSTLKNKEFSKIKLLKPDRYIVATSISLNAQQKDEIKKILAPFVKTSNDIIGKEDLNGLLTKYPQIEKNHFKLWFSSTNVITSILNNAVESRSKYLLEKLKKNVQYYVITSKLDEGNEILITEKLLLITGQPGIGKTTLAELLILEKAYQGFEIYQVENISEAENIVSNDDNKPQLFYFDDFLGANYSEIINAHKTETQLTRFVERIKNTPNKFIVLTTRTVILNQAIQHYEKIGRSSLSSNQFELKLNDYDKYEKALILYNHMYFRGLRSELFEVILKDKFYNKIISHRNYTPRLIEFITDLNQTRTLLPDTYREFILLNLNNPKEIWRSSFNNQILYLDKCLLLTLFTFEKSALEKELEVAFEERLQFETKFHNQIVSSNQFQVSIKVLLNGFISSNLDVTGKQVRDYAFINPSLADFLIAYIAESESEQKAIISSLIYEEQLQRFNPSKSPLRLSISLQMILRDRIADEFIIIKGNDNQQNSKLAEILCRYCSSINIDAILLKHFSAINFNDNLYSVIDNISYILFNVGDSPQTVKYIKDNFPIISESFISNIDNMDMVSEILNVFLLFDQDYEAFAESEKGEELLIDVAKTILQNTEENLKDTYKEQASSMEDVEKYYGEIDDVENDLKSILFPKTKVYFDYYYDIDQEYWHEHIANNMRDYDRDYSDYREYKNRPSSEEMDGFKSEEDMIDDLFSGE